MKSGNLTRTSGFVVAADEGQPFWFLNTLTITKVGSDQCRGQLSILDHRVPPGFAPPPHLHHHSDEALLILDGQLKGFCGDHRWRAGPGSLVFWSPRTLVDRFPLCRICIRNISRFLKTQRTQLPQAALFPDAVVVPLDVVEYRGPGLFGISP